MFTLRSVHNLAFLVAFSMLVASPLVAQRTFVSAQHGSDSNPCSVASPCRTFAAAISAVAAGGEVVVLDSGGYGQFTVSKAVSVETPAGIYAGVSATAGDGIDVSAGASDIVVLRGLTVYGFSGANDGINFTSGAALHVESCIVNGFPTWGIYQTANATLYLTDTTLRNGGGGIFLNPSTNSTASVDHCRIQNNSGIGFAAVDGVKADVRDCVSSNNSTGFEAGGYSIVAEVNLENCLASNNTGSGVATVNTAGVVRISGSTVTANGTGLYQQGSETLGSWGGNHVAGNGTDILGTITPLSNH
jgi:hypothetical protein